MNRYLDRTPKKDYPPNVRLVHNFFPGPPNDPGQDRPFGERGFRAWVTDEDPLPTERQCFCGWLGRPHFGTVSVILDNGTPDTARRQLVKASELTAPPSELD